jgi:hypothetical protein
MGGELSDAETLDSDSEDSREDDDEDEYDYDDGFCVRDDDVMNEYVKFKG